MFNGLGGLSRLSGMVTRSISPEHFTGEKGKGGMYDKGTGAKFAVDLGLGWKISPSVDIQPGETFVMADIPATSGDGNILFSQLVFQDRVTESAALSAARWLGRGDKNAGVHD